MPSPIADLTPKAHTPTPPFALGTVALASSILPEGPNPCPPPTAAGTSYLTVKSTTTSNSAAISSPVAPPFAPNPIPKSFSKPGQRMVPTVFPASTACSPSPSGTPVKNASPLPETPSELNPSTTPITAGSYFSPPNSAHFSVFPTSAPVSILPRSISTSP